MAKESSLKHEEEEKKTEEEEIKEKEKNAVESVRDIINMAIEKGGEGITREKIQEWAQLGKKKERKTEEGPTLKVSKTMKRPSIEEKRASIRGLRSALDLSNKMDNIERPITEWVRA